MNECVEKRKVWSGREGGRWLGTFEFCLCIYSPILVNLWIVVLRCDMLVRGSSPLITCHDIEMLWFVWIEWLLLLEMSRLCVQWIVIIFECCIWVANSFSEVYVLMWPSVFSVWWLTLHVTMWQIFWRLVPVVVVWGEGCFYFFWNDDMCNLAHVSCTYPQ
jgi:hypothetical protein